MFSKRSSKLRKLNKQEIGSTEPSAEVPKSISEIMRNSHNPLWKFRGTGYPARAPSRNCLTEELIEFSRISRALDSGSTEVSHLFRSKRREEPLTLN